MKPRPEDPVLRSARREALIVFGIWLAACIYTVGFCAAYGYERDPVSLTFVFGIPDWVFYGIFLPWTVCTILSFIVSNFVIRDEDLGEEQSEASLDRADAAAKQGKNHA
jgi:uncharacterized membrane protein YhdT